MNKQPILSTIKYKFYQSLICYINHIFLIVWFTPEKRPSIHANPSKLINQVQYFKQYINTVIYRIEFYIQTQEHFKNIMNDQQIYSDSNNCGFSQDIEQHDKNIKKQTQNKQQFKNNDPIYSSQNLLKQSGILGIPTLKNKYANKIKSIANEIDFTDLNKEKCNLAKQLQMLSKNQSSMSSSFINKQQDGQSEYNQAALTNKASSMMDKKQRNKQSAKLSRDRKKLYIQMLEQKQKTLNKKLLNKKKQLQQTKNYLDRVISQNKALSGFAASRHQMIKKIQSVLYNKQMTEQQKNKHLNQLLDNLRYKIGAIGKQRLNTINQYFRQIVNLSLPALHRYMMWSATQQKHLFSSNDQQQITDQWYKQLKTSLNLTQQQKQKVRSKKLFLQQQRKILQKLISRLKEIKNQIQGKSVELEDLIDGIRSILTPIQSANFILFIQKNKYRKELNLCDQLQDYNKKNRASSFMAEYMDDVPRKMIKTQKTQSAS